jgi:hypothetical protein
VNVAKWEINEEGNMSVVGKVAKINFIIPNKKEKLSPRLIASFRYNFNGRNI